MKNKKNIMGRGEPVEKKIIPPWVLSQVVVNDGEETEGKGQKIFGGRPTKLDEGACVRTHHKLEVPLFAVHPAKGTLKLIISHPRARPQYPVSVCDCWCCFFRIHSDPTWFNPRHCARGQLPYILSIQSVTCERPTKEGIHI
jgi:hypothetical protein